MTNRIAREWERGILARILLENHAPENYALASLEPEDFQDGRNVLIFARMKELAAEGKTVTLESLSNRLGELGQLEKAGGEDYLLEFASAIVAGGFNVPDSARKSPLCEFGGGSV